MMKQTMLIRRRSRLGIVRKRTASIRIIAGLALITISAITGVILVELICYFFAPSIMTRSVDPWNSRIMFFDGNSTIFQNDDDIFTYIPDNDVRHFTVYFSDHDFVVEYDYRLHTNNFGLVQNSDITPTLPSVLLLGDSFTEGQGAEPWFSQLTSETADLPYQINQWGLAWNRL
jgi:hypothetical protein